MFENQCAVAISMVDIVGNQSDLGRHPNAIESRLASARLYKRDISCRKQLIGVKDSTTCCRYREWAITNGLRSMTTHSKNCFQLVRIDNGSNDRLIQDLTTGLHRNQALDLLNHM